MDYTKLTHLKNMKVYVVKAPYGEYEDYYEPIIGIFTDEAKADEVISKRNAAIAENDRKREHCEKCAYYRRKLPVGTVKVDGLPCWKGTERADMWRSEELRYIFLQCEGNFIRTDDTLHECIKEEIELDTLQWEPDDLS